MSGRLYPPVKAAVVHDIRLGVIELLEESMCRWEKDGWFRYNDEESNCTIRLYVFAEQTIRETPRFGVFRVTYDTAHPTKDMLEGRESTRKAARPDLIVHLGDTGILVECKRLGTHSSQPGKYVNNGIDRFITGSYAAPHGFGVMVGYVQTGNRVKYVHAINRNIERHEAMGSSHCLVPVPSTRRYQSNHVRPHAIDVNLEHLLPCIGGFH